MQFSSFNLSEPLLSALEKAGYHTPTPIQAQAIPTIMQKRDVLACAQTGTGKTASFALPLIELLLHQGTGRPAGPKALILAPTRELAIQIGENIGIYAALTRIKHAVVFGGVSINNQIGELRKRPEILVATPGRLLDLLNQGAVSLSAIGFLVLDEADRMLDMGFIKDIKKIISLVPDRRQTLLFSATMPKNIEDFAQAILTNPERIAVTPVSSTAEKIEQLVFPVAKSDKPGLLEHLIKQEKDGYILVFSRTKHGADRIVRKLKQSRITAEAIHGNKSQQARQKALKQFKDGTIKVLVATDIAARGIDVDNLHLVINYDLPNEPETYVHRIGRTGRAGASGRAWSFCDIEEREYLWDIQQLIGREIDRNTDHPFPMDGTVSFAKPQKQQPARSANHPQKNKRNKNKRKTKRAYSAA
ncbi:DEAD/DEAH box helicase [Parapedobacter koreensis]|uniref:DEAD-box ATP-dependent RNA helicase RhpA n=1 Tax=Parapedobacter koreensis TaxID=332977 RepID=A0A1H7IXD1_9SPHI|nr:DEAD/DEAH box helicase [Parapedobacter koreensis]SEK66317.1 ATP-dependent RNA helicase RhlE [Parapedobacter koreensis]